MFSSQTNVPLKPETIDALTEMMREILQEDPYGLSKIHAAIARASEVIEWGGPPISVAPTTAPKGAMDRLSKRQTQH